MTIRALPVSFILIAINVAISFIGFQYAQILYNMAFIVGPFCKEITIAFSPRAFCM